MGIYILPFYLLAEAETDSVDEIRLQDFSALIYVGQQYLLIILRIDDLTVFSE